MMTREERTQAPYTIRDFLTSEEIQIVLDEALGFEGERQYTPGGAALHKFWPPRVADIFSSKIERYLPASSVKLARLRYRLKNVDIHSDNVKGGSSEGAKGVLIPLAIHPEQSQYHFVVLQQRWRGAGPVGITDSGELEETTVSGKTIRNKRELVGFTNRPMPEEIAKSLLRSFTPQQLFGLSVDSIFPWRPGEAIVFDRDQLHCSESFLNARTFFRIGLQIFCERNVREG